MTLDELQAEFPLDSRWRYDSTSDNVQRVCGWVERVGWVLSYPELGGQVCTTHFTNFRVFERIPDPVPCPITEPTTLIPFTPGGFAGHSDRVGWSTHASGSSLIGGPPAITLHPAEPGATEGRYTWEQP